MGLDQQHDRGRRERAPARDAARPPGLTTTRRIKAIFWWCYMHTEAPLAPAEILRVMPTDGQVDGLLSSPPGKRRRDDGAPEEYGSGIDRSEFHMLTRHRR